VAQQQLQANKMTEVENNFNVKTSKRGDKKMFHVFLLLAFKGALAPI
jgi:hypothetical protein